MIQPHLAGLGKNTGWWGPVPSKRSRRQGWAPPVCPVQLLPVAPLQPLELPQGALAIPSTPQNPKPASAKQVSSGAPRQSHGITINRIMTPSRWLAPAKTIITFWESRMAPCRALTNGTVIYCNLHVSHFTPFMGFQMTPELCCLHF